MAPVAQTLALLAMAVVATAAIEVVPLDMAWNSFDDQYLKCSDEMTKKLPELQKSDFLENPEFANNWDNATKTWENKTPLLSRLKIFLSRYTKDEAVALMAYTMNFTGLYKKFNRATCEAGESSKKYKNEFPFKSLHFLLTRALQNLRHPNECKNVFRGEKNHQFIVEKDAKVRFGKFTSTSLSETVARDYGQGTVFKVYTCHGADIQKFSYFPSEEEVLIPPFETFRVIDVSEKGNTMHIELKSIGTFSNYNCEWLKGGGLTSNSPHLPRNSPQLGGLLLATVAMAVVTGTL